MYDSIYTCTIDMDTQTHKRAAAISAAVTEESGFVTGGLEASEGDSS